MEMVPKIAAYAFAQRVDPQHHPVKVGQMFPADIAVVKADPALRPALNRPCQSGVLTDA